MAFVIKNIFLQLKIEICMKKIIFLMENMTIMDKIN